MALAKLRAKEQALVDQRVANDGSLAIGSNNHISHIVNTYQQGGNRLADTRLHQAVPDYAGWKMESYISIHLHDLSDRQYHLHDSSLAIRLHSFSSNKVTTFCS